MDLLHLPLLNNGAGVLARRALTLITDTQRRQIEVFQRRRHFPMQVVILPLLAIRDRFVGFVDRGPASRGIWVIWQALRVVFQGEAAVGSGTSISIGRAGD